MTSGPRRSRLTADEGRIARSAEIDLGVGYPQFVPVSPRWAKWSNLPLTELIEEYVLATPEADSIGREGVPKQEVLQRMLLDAAGQFLGLTNRVAQRGFVVHTGSHALDRVTAAMLGRGRGHVVTSDPCIDVIPAIVSEHQAALRFAPSIAPKFLHDVDGILDRADGNCSFVIVTSPENPTGAVLEGEALSHLGSELGRRQIPIVVDQSFAKVQPFASVPLAVDHFNPEGLWAVTWDTGKMVDAFDQKLGFIFCGEVLRAHVGHRVQTLQCTLPSRALMELRLMLLDGARDRFFMEFSRRIAQNVAVVESELDGSPLVPIRPKAGGFMLLDIRSVIPQQAASDLAQDLLEQTGVGVIGGERFFHSSSTGALYLRVALARDPERLREGVARIREVVERNALRGRPRAR